MGTKILQLRQNMTPALTPAPLGHLGEQALERGRIRQPPIRIRDRRCDARLIVRQRALTDLMGRDPGVSMSARA